MVSGRASRSLVKSHMPARGLQATGPIILFKKCSMVHMSMLQAQPTGTTPVQHKHTVYSASVYHLAPPLAGGGASGLLGGASLSSRGSLAAAPKRRGGPSRGAEGPSLAAPRGPPPQLEGASLAGASRAAGQPQSYQSSSLRRQRGSLSVWHQCSRTHCTNCVHMNILLNIAVYFPQDTYVQTTTLLL